MLPTKTVLVIALSLTWGFAAGEPLGQPEPDWAEPMPLVRRSLLLDGAVHENLIIVVGERGHILSSDDRGQSWTQARVPTRSTLTAVTIVGPDHAWAVGHDSVVLHSSDGGTSWILQHYAPHAERPLLDVWFADRHRGLAVGAYGTVMTTANGGELWESTSIDDEDPHAHMIAAAPDGRLYVAAEFGLVFRSEDQGASWVRVQTPYRGSLFGVLALSHGPLLTFGLRGRLYRSTDGGDNWRLIETNTTAALLTGLSRRNGTVLVAGLSGVVLTSADRGLSFDTHHLPGGPGIAALMELDPDRLLALGDAGLSWLEEPVRRSSSGTAAAR